jgi:diguanylate cyclase (GGDEF)-like protein/PAS domain S-box-containing protein
MHGLRGDDRDVPLLSSELLNPAHYQFDPLSLWHFGAAVVVGLTAALILYWERGSRVSRFLAGFSLLFLLWAAGRGVLRLMTDPDLSLFLARRVFVFILLALPFLYQFATILLRSEARRATIIRINWGIGITMSLLSVSTVSVLSAWTRYPWGIEPLYGALGYIVLPWVALMVSLTSLDAYRAWWAASAGSQERQRVGLFCLSLLILYFAFVEFLPGLGFNVYPLAFVPICLFTLLTAYITYRFGLVEVTPELAAQKLAGMVPGALLILDSDGMIRFANERSQSVLGIRNDALVGRNAVALLGDSFDPVRLAVLAGAEGRDAERDFFHTHPDTGRDRELSLSVSTVQDLHARDVAYVCQLRDVTEHKRVERQRMLEGLTDKLTGLPNRALFLELLDRQARQSANQQSSCYVCFVGLDRMRIINDDLGYAVGDSVLKEVADRLRRVAGSGDTVARIGGDEFAILSDARTPTDLEALLQRVREAIQTPLMLSDHKLYLSASIGVASGEHEYSGGADLLRSAGIAMHRVKEQGGGATHRLVPGEAGAQRTRLEADLRRAIESAEFRVHYQPVVDLRERRVVGFEALVRWQHPERGLLLPGEFIEFAEEIGLIAPIDFWVMGQACVDLERFHSETGNRDLYVNVNIAEECLGEHRVVGRVKENLRQHSLPAASLRLEVPERVVLIGPIQDTLQKLRRLGVGLCIDDFGTGYSALSRLHELPINVVKVDRALVRAMTLGAGGEKVIGGILALAENLGLGVVAEGAGLVTEVQRLRKLGCRYVQGFYFSHAVNAGSALELVQDQAVFQAKFADLDRELPPSEERKLIGAGSLPH